jgi:hypothetical protein
MSTGHAPPVAERGSGCWWQWPDGSVTGGDGPEHIHPPAGWPRTPTIAALPPAADAVTTDPTEED